MAENIYTNDDLKTMQAWPLSQKIQVTQAKIIEWYHRHNGLCTVSWSGGKDSGCLLYLARRCFPDIEAVFVDTGLELPEVRAFALAQPNVTILKPAMRFDEVIRTYGWCYPSKDVARTLRYAAKGSKWALERLRGVNPDGTPCAFRESRYKKWAFLLDSGIPISDICCEIMKENPLNEYSKRTGKYPFIGTLAVESRRRKESWLRRGCNAYGKKHPSSQPLSFWTEEDILRCTLEYNIPYASVYGEIVEDKKGRLYTTGERRTGCCFCPVSCHRDKVNRFQRLAVTHPKLHEYVIYTLGLHELLDYIGVDYGKAGATCPSEK
jgi:3'-phosphoadenosine 5'-phosphosulfate sulfotransferase (PAPS reductase)/FAD synthetase